MYGKQKVPQRKLKSTLSYDVVKKKRKERHALLRKKKREVHLAKRRKEDVGAYDEEIKKQISQIPNMLAMMKSNNLNHQLEGTKYFRKLLSIEKTPPIDEVVRCGVIVFLVNFLKSPSQKLQFEALWAITNICSGSAPHINVIIQNHCIPLLVKLLSSNYPEIQEQSVWALGNICGESAPYRDYVLRCGVLHPLIKMISTPNIRRGCLRNAVWTLSNVVRAKPAPPFETVKRCLPILSYLITRTDHEVLVDSLWAISYISDGDEDRIQAILDSNIIKQLIGFLFNPKPEIQTPALRTIGNLVTGSDEQTQDVIDAGGLAGIRNLLNHSRRSIKKEAVWTVSNITAGTATQIQSVFQANIFPPLIKIVSTAEFEIKKEASWALSNATSSASDEQVLQLVKFGCIRPLVDLLSINDTTIIVVALEGLSNILERGEKFESKYNGENPFAKHIEQANGVRKLEELQHSPNRDVYNKAMKLLEKYFDDSNEEFDNYSFMNNIQKQDYTFE